MIELAHVERRFGAVLALEDVSLTVRAGEIHALAGENGAGKSTLAAIAAGTLLPTGGVVRRDGAAGFVHQHFELARRLRVWENVLLGREPRRGLAIDAARARAHVRDLGERYGLAVDPDAVVERLPVGVAQRVEILRELAREPAALLLDEPTAVLAPAEIEALFAALRALAQRGMAVLVITHKLGEVVRHADRVTVLRAGRVVAGFTRADGLDAAAIARAMVGGEMPALAARTETERRPALRFDGVTTSATPGSTALEGIDLTIDGGEIVGVAGVEGNGQTALADAAGGLVPYEGRISLGDAPLDALSPAGRIAAGLRAIAQDRHHEALVLDWSIAANLALGDQRRPPLRRGAFLDRRRIASEAAEAVRRYDVRPASPLTRVRALSGGNQQKVVVARALAGAPRAVVAYQPTRGVDVGAQVLLQSRLIDARNAGVAVLLVSFELDELFALADRIVVLSRGRIVGRYERGAFDRRRIGELMAGTA